MATLRNQQQRSDGQREAGFYGLDLYSLHRSMHEVISYLDKVDPKAAARARERYACFDHATADDGQAYGFSAAFGAGPSCETQAVEQLVDMQRNALAYARRDGLLAEDELFYAEQNAQTVRNAEVYYRAMFSGRVNSWNLRDTHMAQTLEALAKHLDRHSDVPTARIMVWADNSHVGDARATEVWAEGQLTLGQLVRQRYGEDSRLIGFSTYAGTVTAASEWGGMAERKAIRPALNGSIEELLHETGQTSFLVSALISPEAADPLSAVRLGRAIGVIYRPETERQSHYFHVRPADQFDAMIHIDRTRALEPWSPPASGLPAKPRKRIPPDCNQRSGVNGHGYARRIGARRVQLVTLTMNPALDITTSIDVVRPTDKMRCKTTRYDPGGGGINVARVAHVLGA